MMPDGTRAVSASDDHTVRVWDLMNGREMGFFMGESPIACCSVASDGKTIVAGDESGRVHFLQLQM
jgi:WD40 repeat protein